MDISEIELKEFNKLKQLDRIELLLKIDNLRKKEENSYFSWYNITNPICVIIGTIYNSITEIKNRKIRYELKKEYFKT
jgi:hypothetical protein